MKSKTLAFATLLMVTAFLLMQAITPHTVLAAAAWTNTNGGVSSYGVVSFAYDSGHNLLYAGTYNNGVWKYNGTTWTNTGGGVSSYHIYSLAYDSGHNLLYAGCADFTANTNEGVWKYNGTTWTNTGGGLSTYGALSLAYDSHHNLLYAGCSSTSSGKGVWKYNGTTWTDISGVVSSYPILSLAYDSGHNLLYAGTDGHGVWKYNGTTWTNTGGGVSSYYVRSFAYDSGHNLLYAGTDGHGVWKYDGASWSDTAGAVSSWPIDSLAYDSGHNQLYAGVYGAEGVWEYNGTTWTSTGGGVSSYIIYALAYDSGHNLLYAGTGGHGVWYYGVTPSSTFYFAEGTCRPGFDPYFCIQNPGGAAANVTLTYMKGDGTSATDQVTVPKNSRVTVSPRNKLGTGNDDAHDFSTKVACTNGQIICERPMYFNYNGVWTGGHDVVGATTPASTYYFAEGTCRPGFDPYFCIQNPGTTAAKVTLTYMKGDGTSATDQVTVPKNSRVTVSPRNKLGTGNDAAHDFSTKMTSNQPIIAERPMYFNYNGVWTGGSDVVGATSPAINWYFAEGTTRPNFDPYLSIQNPGSAAANVTLTYMKGDGTSATDNVTVPKHSRATVSPRNKLGTGNEAAHDFSIKATCTNSQSIIVERSMYFNYNGVWTGGHDVMGSVAPASDYYFAEGTCRPNFDPYLTIQNPGNSSAKVHVAYMKGDGTSATQDIIVAKNSRYTLSPRDKIGTADDAAHDFSTRVTCTNSQKIICERSMYFNYKGVWTGGSDVMGFTP